MLTLTWDRPHQRMDGAEQRYLRARVSPDGQLAGRPVDVLLLLDASSSMRGEPYRRAKIACELLARTLRPRDRLDCAVFHGEVRDVVTGLTGADKAETLKQALDETPTGYGTRIDLALDWLIRRATPRPGRMRLAVMVTDGVPYDAQRRPVTDFTGLRAQADALGRVGLVLNPIGLGPPEAFYSVLLHDLARRTQGRFLLAPTAEALEAVLIDALLPARDVVDESATLSVEPLLPGLRLDDVCRVLPSFARLSSTRESSGWRIPLGAIEGQGRNDFLLRCHVAGPGAIAPQGERRIARVTLALADLAV